MGRKAHQPDPVSRRQVEAMAGYGVPEADIARVLAIDAKTLRRRYRDELDTGHIKANSRVAESLYRKATGEGAQSVTAAIFWLKTRASWKEASIHEVTGKDGAPLIIEIQRFGGHADAPAGADETLKAAAARPPIGQIEARRP